MKFKDGDVMSSLSRKIDVQYLAPSAIEPLLLTQFKAGSAPDLFFIKAGRIRSNGVWPMAEATVI